MVRVRVRGRVRVRVRVSNRLRVRVRSPLGVEDVEFRRSSDVEDLSVGRGKSPSVKPSMGRGIRPALLPLRVQRPKPDAVRDRPSATPVDNPFGAATVDFEGASPAFFKIGDGLCLVFFFKIGDGLSPF